MKKILFLSILCSLLFIGHAFATATLSVTPSGTALNAKLENVTNTDTYVLVVQKELFTSDLYTGDATTGLTAEQFDQRKKHSDTATLKNPVTLTWSIGGFEANATYYARVADIPPAPGKATYVTAAFPIKTGDAVIPFLPLTTAPDGNNIVVSGKIDVSKVPDFNPANFSATLLYSASIPAEGATTLTDPFGPIQSHKTPDNTVCDTNAGPCINSDGTYYWYLTNLHPSTTYYFQQTVKVDKTSKVDVINRFNSSVGTTIAPGSAEDIADRQSRGYTLLSKGFPGLSFLPDPDLCAQDRAAALAGGKPAPQFCDINDVLNYFLKLLIGISGVILVFRLMYEGFVIMTTDVPFIGAKSKGSFKTALMGLLLAMTSYIILNTINPKLVSEDVGIQQLAIGIDGDSNVPTIFVDTGKMPQNVFCPNNGKSAAIAKIAQSYSGKVTYSQANKSATAQSDGFARLDCSGFVNTVLKCAGYVPGKDFINEGTISIFAGAESVNMSSGFRITGNDVYINDKKLNPGDLIGWTPAQGGGNGHVIIYIGNLTFMDSHGGGGHPPGKAIGSYSASKIQQLYGSSTSSKTIKEIKRIPSL